MQEQNDAKPNFLDRIVDLKTNKGFTQRRIAEKLGITEDYVSRIVNGREVPSPQLKAAIEMLWKSEFPIRINLGPSESEYLPGNQPLLNAGAQYPVPTEHPGTVSVTDSRVDTGLRWLVKSQEVRAYMENLLAATQANEDQVTWLLAELKRHFPMGLSISVSENSGINSKPAK